MMTKTETMTLARILADAYQVPPCEVIRLMGLVKNYGGAFGRPMTWQIDARLGLHGEQGKDVTIKSTISATDCTISALRAYWEDDNGRKK